MLTAKTYLIVIISLILSSCKHNSSELSTSSPSHSCEEKLELYPEAPPPEEKMFFKDEPINISRGLSESHYTAEEAYRIKLSEIQHVDLNHSYLRELGFKTWGAHGRDLKLRFIRRFALVTKKTVERLNLHDKVELDKSYTVYPDLYGGFTGGRNYGSGRAGSLGGISIKGIGYTELSTRKVKLWSDTLATNEEAVVSKLQRNQIPHNRVLAYIKVDEGKHIVVREDPVRMGHFLDFQPNAKERLHNGLLKNKNQQRILENPCLLRRAYANLNPNSLNWKLGFRQSIKNLAKNLAKQLINGVTHTAPTAANIAVQGYFTDLESFLIYQNTNPFVFHTVAGPLNNKLNSADAFKSIYGNNLPMTYDKGLKFQFDHLYLPLFQEMAKAIGLKPKEVHYQDVFYQSFLSQFAKDLLYKGGLAPKNVEEFPISKVMHLVPGVLRELWGRAFPVSGYDYCFKKGKCSLIKKQVVRFLKDKYGLTKDMTKKVLNKNRTTFPKVPYTLIRNLLESPSWTLTKAAHNKKTGTSYLVFYDLLKQKSIHKIFIPRVNGIYNGLYGSPESIEDIAIQISGGQNWDKKERQDGAYFTMDSGSKSADIPEVYINSMRAFGIDRSWSW